MSEALKYLKKSNKFDKDEKVKSLQTRIAEMEHFEQVHPYTIASLTINLTNPYVLHIVSLDDVTLRKLLMIFSG